jgi:acyl-CoA carboxylase subunit beta
MITASVPTIKGGSTNEMTLLKGARAAQIAWENRLPTILLLQSV